MDFDFDAVLGFMRTIGMFILFIAISLVFLPALLITNVTHKWWSDALGELFGV